MTDVLEVVESKDGDIIIKFPDELCEELGWREGDVLDWRFKGAGVVISKVNEPEGFVPVE